MLGAFVVGFVVYLIAELVAYWPFPMQVEQLVNGTFAVKQLNLTVSQCEVPDLPFQLLTSSDFDPEGLEEDLVRCAQV